MSLKLRDICFYGLICFQLLIASSCGDSGRGDESAEEGKSSISFDIPNFQALDMPLETIEDENEIGLLQKEFDFIEFCQNHESIDDDSLHTLNELFDLISLEPSYSDENCHLAYNRLQNLGEIDLSSREIKRIAPIKGLNETVILNLDSNKIIDIDELCNSDFSMLKVLSLRDSGIDNIEALPNCHFESLVELRWP
jgi:Leucine-rich repeat (LRR) protein